MCPVVVQLGEEDRVDLSRVDTERVHGDQRRRATVQEEAEGFYQRRYTPACDRRFRRRHHFPRIEPGRASRCSLTVPPPGLPKRLGRSACFVQIRLIHPSGIEYTNSQQV
jgi:hypothetical protein